MPQAPLTRNPYDAADPHHYRFLADGAGHHYPSQCPHCIAHPDHGFIHCPCEPSPTEIKAMRDWLADIEFADIESYQLADEADVAVLAAVERLYEGGVARFIAEERA